MSTLAATNVKNPSAVSNNIVLNTDGTIRLPVTKTPASAVATGTAGDWAYDSNYIYVCVATNSWKRVAIATW